MRVFTAPPQEAQCHAMVVPIEADEAGNNLLLLSAVIFAAKLSPRPFSSQDATAYFVTVSCLTLSWWWCNRRLYSSCRSKISTFLKRLRFHVPPDCTYGHFQNSSSCPKCKIMLGQNDFLELCVADPSAQGESQKVAFQQLFTKSRAEAKYLSYHDMCMHTLTALSNCQREVKFLMKQMHGNMSTQGKSSDDLKRAVQKWQAEYNQLKQKATSEEVQYKQHALEMQTRVSALSKEVEDLTEQLQAKDKTISQFRQQFSRASSGSRSSHSYGSNNMDTYQQDAMRPRISDPNPPFRNKRQMPPPSGANLTRPSRMPRGNQPISNYSFNGKTITTTPIHIPTGPGIRPSPNSQGRVRNIDASSAYTFNNSRPQTSPTMRFARNQRYH